jgi:drug/metabolite transporter (DMT)-like permease
VVEEEQEQLPSPNEQERDKQKRDEQERSFSGAGRQRRLRAYRLLALLLILRPFGNLSLAWGIKHISAALSINPFLYIRAMLNPFVALGIGMLILALLTRMALLSLADLSYVLPLTAFGYVLSTMLGKFFLNEQVSYQRWAGTFLIFFGTALVSTTSARSSGASDLVRLE